ncbi:MAG: S-adenosylmethionine:tRNA ribosyltransferase-isomerase, partial [Bacteroidales bacterium]|nr:S-adenosylmethionine:tRNA ribosyltransferase-isomerase [Bacteroidales bacterium]
RDFQLFTKEETLSALIVYLENNDQTFISGSTSLLIKPGFKHQIVKGIITNFHQPKSTLLLLIASFLGEEWKRIYKHALTHDYRFLSYGDSNLYL